MTKHIVMFKLQGTDELRRQTALRFKQALDALPEQIDVLQSIEVAINENPAEDWDVVLTAIVPTIVFHHSSGAAVNEGKKTGLQNGALFFYSTVNSQS